MLKKKLAVLLAAAAVWAGTCGCAPIPANTVFCEEDLVGKTIACKLGTTGYSMAGEIEDAVVEGYVKGADAIRALTRGKADAVIIDNEMAMQYVEKNDALRILEEPYAEEDYALAYRKDDLELGDKIDNALSELKEDGTLDSILGHWIGEHADNDSYVPDPTIARSGVLRIATDATFPPFENLEEEAIVGIDIDIANAICDKLGMEPFIENMSFKELFPALENDQADVIACALTITPARQALYGFTQSYVSTTQVIIVRSE